MIKGVLKLCLKTKIIELIAVLLKNCQLEIYWTFSTLLNVVCDSVWEENKKEREKNIKKKFKDMDIRYNYYLGR